MAKNTSILKILTNNLFNGLKIKFLISIHDFGKTILLHVIFYTFLLFQAREICRRIACRDQYKCIGKFIRLYFKTYKYSCYSVNDMKTILLKNKQ